MSIFLVLLTTYLIFNGQVEGKKGYGGEGAQEWGYVKVRENAQMFWWLHYVNPQTKNENFSVFEKPLLIWLQGGPGASSTGYGNFEELGPIDLDGNVRNYTWVNDYNVLFIDNPIGTGFSYAETFSAYAKTNRQIAEDLIECIRGFLNEFPDFIKVPTYITAESYGGKMGVEFAYLWFKKQQTGEIKSNLKGIAMGNSAISTLDAALSWAPFLLATGMVDTRGFEEIQAAALKIKIAVEEERWHDAFTERLTTEEIIQNITNNMDKYNYLSEMSPKVRGKINIPSIIRSKEDSDKLLDDLMNNKVKQALNLNVTWSAQRENVYINLYDERLKPVTNFVEKLLNETDLEVFVYSGQLDVVMSTPSTVVWVEKLNWHGANAWKNAPRNPLVVDNIIEGYVKKIGKLNLYWINRSGHMVPRDNPYATGAMLKHLTSPTT